MIHPYVYVVLFLVPVHAVDQEPCLIQTRQCSPAIWLAAFRAQIIACSVTVILTCCWASMAVASLLVHTYVPAWRFVTLHCAYASSNT